MTNAFTVDVEDYFQVSGFEAIIQRSAWRGFESRVIANTLRLLDLMDRHGVQGTFFILGWVADHYPGLVREIHERGHEIGSHSYWHRLVYEQTADEFRDDLCRSRNVIEDIIGVPVTAYRAPSFSITQRSMWALEILVEEGFTMDSSVVPIHHDRYGIPGAKRGPHMLKTPSGSILEFPPSVARFAGLNLPVGGGGYFRLFPIAWTIYWLGRLGYLPIMFYVHPWEIDPDQPRLHVGSPMSRFRHYVHLATTEHKLDQLLNHFAFGSMSASVGESIPDSQPNSIEDSHRHSL
jgi:polysaccharide deacetylase family protein (PEP-CTERM system associated)